MRKNGWSPEEDAILREHYPKIGTAVGSMLGRTKKMCECRARVLGVKRVYEPNEEAKKCREYRARLKTRTNADLYGYIPGGPVRSVFDLASAGGGR